jgi:hypothetical protein
LTIFVHGWLHFKLKKIAIFPKNTSDTVHLFLDERPLHGLAHLLRLVAHRRGRADLRQGPEKHENNAIKLTSDVSGQGLLCTKKLQKSNLG